MADTRFENYLFQGIAAPGILLEQVMDNLSASTKYYLYDKVDGLADWWDFKVARRDEAKVREGQRLIALAKLTSYERELLGLDDNQG